MIRLYLFLTWAASATGSAADGTLGVGIPLCSIMTLEDSPHVAPTVVFAAHHFLPPAAASPLTTEGWACFPKQILWG